MGIQSQTDLSGDLTRGYTSHTIRIMRQRLLNQPWKKFEGTAILLVVAGVLVLPRVLALGRFVTADEPIWGKRSANFYYALSNKEYSVTYQVAHPGVITMWAGAAAYWIKFPSYKNVGLGELGDTKLFQIFQRHGPNPLEVLATARLFVVLIIVATLIVGFFFVKKLFGSLIAVCGFILISFDPFFLAHSRFLHVDALLSTFMFVSLLAFLAYLKDRKRFELFVSGIFVGLSLLTKTPGVVLIPVIGLLAVLDWWVKSRDKPLDLGNWFKRVGWPLVNWGVAIVIVFVGFWPAMWTNPIGTLSNMAQYSVESAQGEVGGAQFVQAFEESDQPGSNYLNFYPLTYLWRSPPIVLIGLVAALAAFIKRKNLLRTEVDGFSIFGMVLLVFTFTVVLSLSSKKFDRYLLPVYLPLDLMAGIGWVSLSKWFIGKIPRERTTLALSLILGIVCIVQVGGTMEHYPYYLTYYNPLLGGSKKAPETMMIGWGEGLNQAALYLKAIPNFKEKRVISWYSLAFNWYSSSLGFVADPIPFEVLDQEIYFQDLASVDYAVIYANEWQRQLPKPLFDYLDGRTPIQSIWINDLEYVRIYQLEPK